MNAIDRIYGQLLEQFPTERITTTQAAEAVGLTRGVTSNYLSKLHKTGKLIKTGSRPVYWQIKREHSAFDDLIGSNGSLSTNIQLAIEAIVYPRHGLPIFITGPSGSGKLPFAQAIYHESIRRNVLSTNAVFKLIDCANYKDQVGTLKKKLQSVNTTTASDIATEAVYIYVKNIQMLSTSDQHYLFTHTSQQQSESFRYIYSGTDDIFETARVWFKSAAVQLKLNSFSSLPLNERVEFAAFYLQQQSDQLNTDIQITPSELINLANFEHINNITALNNRVQLLCADAYAKAPDHTHLLLGSSSDAAILVTPHQQNLRIGIKSLVTSALQLGPTTDSMLKKLNDSLTNGESITEQQFILSKVLNQIDTISNDKILFSVAQTVQKTITKCISHNYGIKFPRDETFWENVALGFVFAGICRDNLTDTQSARQMQKAIKHRYPRSYYLFTQLLNNLNEQQEQNPYCYLPFFMIMTNCASSIESVKYNAILLSHGENTASSIQQVANSLCGNYVFEAFDMPIDVTIDQISSHVSEYLSNQSPSAKGNIVLFDMGSLRQMFREIKSVSDQELLVVNNVTTAMALDIGLRIQRNDEFQSIAEASEHYGETTETQYFEGLSNKKNIIVSCMSGVGLSEEIKKLINTTLSSDIEVITVDYKELNTLLTNHDQKFFSNTQLIMTTTDVASDIGIEIMNVYNIFDKSAALKIQTILRNCGESTHSINELVDRLVRFLSIEGIRGRLQILNPDIVIQESQRIVDHYEDFYSVKFSSRIKLNLYMHLSLMIERMMTSRPSNNSISRATLTKQEQEFFAISSGIFQPIEQKFNIQVQDYEIALLYELIKDFVLK
ncbi:PRD domain-containing protein [Lacticaseibacillus pantheris]|uniref:PRD domain-containing protein n=1 Tax=Lacticaseibacillus pantheris TaxID=171523 RepID=UPI0007055351|nr:PRD domain-containing protein [Lacticaseibacillus pantheris]